MSEDLGHRFAGCVAVEQLHGATATEAVAAHAGDVYPD